MALDSGAVTEEVGLVWNEEVIMEELTARILLRGGDRGIAGRRSVGGGDEEEDWAELQNPGDEHDAHLRRGCAGRRAHAEFVSMLMFLGLRRF